MKLKKEYEEINNEVITKAMEQFSLPYSLVNYIYHLGYDTIEKINNYLFPTSKCFYDPFLFPCMKEICDRIKKAISNNEKILIFGDYDADGIGSTAILYKYFESINVKVDYFLPSRYNDGYGLTIESLDKVKELFNPDLIITVDCGITCINEVEYAKSIGVDILITDHHEPLEELPNCPVIDCKIKGQPYPFKYLCGAGMALKLVYALSDYETAKKYFTICAISTIADIVELEDENRFIVIEGLKSFEENCPIGLKYLFKKLKIKDAPTSSDVSYKIAPKINATGRMGDATIALKLYLEKDNNKINAIYKQIIEMNEKRQAICQKIFEQAQEIVDEKKLHNDSILVMRNDNWETGVLGIVCAKLIETYNKSAILFGKDERTGNYVGSARAVEGVNIYNAISKCADLLVTFGGHEMASGLTVSDFQFNEFKNRINSIVASQGKTIDNSLVYDIECTANEITIEYLEALNRLEPFGVANPKPRFLIKTNNLYSYPMNKHNEHLLIKFDNFSGVMFNKPYYIYTLNNKANKAIFCNPYIELYGTKKNVKLFVNDVFCDNINDFSLDISQGSYFKQYIYALSSTITKNVIEITMNELSKLPKSSVVYISYFSNINKQILSNINYDIADFVYISHKCDDNTLLIAPSNYDGLESFNNIVFLDDVLDNNFINYIQFKYPKANIYFIKRNKERNFCVSTKKDVFINFYTILKDIKEVYFDEINMYKKHFTKYGFNYAQYILCLYVFEELGIIKINREKDFFITIDPKRKTNLYNSSLYCKMLGK
ncbi:MAG: single-stranded-DNA-specific exonuclease RecJ [Clostridia bacterium]|nr:single-stranded-DNA-specific exonuclease RecJ [Clostridia bacterium]